MHPALSTLRKYFRLEAERGYDNRAVLGGLEKMLPLWAAEARADGVDERLVAEVTSRLREYSGLDAAGRAAALKAAWAAIGGSEKQSAASNQRPAKTATTKPQRKPRKTGNAKTADPAPKPAPRKARAPRRAKIEGEPVALDAPTTVLAGVGPVNTERLEKLGIRTLGDMLYHFPRRYEDYSQVVPIRQLQYGQEATIIGTVKSKSRHGAPRGKQVFELVVDDGSAALRATWFNQPWMSKNFSEGDEVALSGKVEQYLGRFTLSSPEWELLEDEQDLQHTSRIVPVYPLTANVGQRWLRGLMKKVVSHWAPRLPELLPASLVEAAGLPALSEALLQIHFPDSQEQLDAARLRIAFDELFLLQLAVLIQKRVWQGQAARRFSAAPGWLDAQTARLPFALTGAQTTALADLLADLDSGRPMNRLLQGDVGSGKTVVAALCMALVAAQGAQSALMAPTSILAEQHYASLGKLLAGAGGPLQAGEIRLMTGATGKAEKDEIRAGLQDGRIKLIIGTHALIEDPVLFDALELIVIDEQHRFGVGQRAALRAKGSNPHLLVMSATPIPRSLALTVYGDLDLSIIGELPPGRQAVSTHVLAPRETERAYNLIRREAAAGRQAFIIYPLIEESETSASKAAVDEYERLGKETFPQLQLALLHGRMSAEDKEKTMTAFRDGQTQVLVSTTVIEVGVDVPNATVMLIEGAERFGLAQLHQLRGRVGRGAEQAHCILIPTRADAAENERLQALTQTNDGFKLAEIDLQQRGPGQFMGFAQAGFGDLQLASLTDSRLIDKARRHAEALLAGDPLLEQAPHKPLAAALHHYLRDGKGDLS